MPVGLQVFDGYGNLKLSMGDRIARFTGSVVTNSADGSLTIPGYDTGTPFYMLVPLEFNPVGYFSPPIMSISGATLSWTYLPTPGGARTNCIVRYGVY